LLALIFHLALKGSVFTMTFASRSTWMRLCGVAAIALLVIFSLIGAAAQPRTVLGWQIEHFLGYFAATLLLCLAWPRPLMVAAAMVVLAGVLEGLQAFTPDREPNFVAVVFGAGGVLTAALLAELWIRTRQR
jgi:VanZ family protein